MAVVVVMMMLSAGLLTRLYQVQIQRGPGLAATGETQRARAWELQASRGRLYDREGQLLASSIDAATIVTDPAAYRSRVNPDGTVTQGVDPVPVARALAPLLGQDVSTILGHLQREGRYAYVARQIDWDLGQTIRDLELPGIVVEAEPRRIYPSGGLAPAVLGYTDIDGLGREGLEHQFNAMLAGEPGLLEFERAPAGLEIANATRQLRPAVQGTDLVLTLDREIQHVAEQAAVRAVDDYSALSASVVVLEVGTGDILAMATAPSFDPHDRTGTTARQRRNRPVTDLFEPGSVQKAVTAVAALAEGVVRPDTAFVVPDRIRIGNKTFSDAHDHEPLNLTFAEIVAQSSNVGTIQVAELLGKQRLADWLDRFGYGSAPGLGFPGEAAGMTLPVEEWWSTSLPTIAIGQGVAVSLVQLANVYATIANGGQSLPPRLVRGQVASDGRLTPDPLPTPLRVVPTNVALTVREILTDVVNAEGGTGGRAAISGYRAAGKTGTARKPASNARGYSDQYVASFVGMAPAEAPRVVVAVMIDEPWPIWGGVVAAPLFAEVADFALTHLKVARDAPSESLAAALSRAEATQARLSAEAAAIEAAKAEGPAIPQAETSSPVSIVPPPSSPEPETERASEPGPDTG